MGETSPTLQRAVMILLAAVIAITLTTGIVGAVNVSSKSTGTVAAGAPQPSAGAQAQPGPQGPAPTTPPLVDTTPTPTVLVPAPMPEQVSAASSGASPNFTTQVIGPAPESSPTSRPTTTTSRPACFATMTNQTAQPGEKDTVEISSDLHNATVAVTAHFRSGDASYKGKTTGSGEAQVNINVPANEFPSQVDVDVLVGTSETCQTSFTIV